MGSSMDLLAAHFFFFFGKTHNIKKWKEIMMMTVPTTHKVRSAAVPSLSSLSLGNVRDGDGCGKL